MLVYYIPELKCQGKRLVSVDCLLTFRKKMYDLSFTGMALISSELHKCQDLSLDSNMSGRFINLCHGMCAERFTRKYVKQGRRLQQ
jgi:hypothetical protein